MKTLSFLEDEINSWNKLEQRVADALELAQLEDEDLTADLEPEVAEITQEIESREFKAMLSGEYDEGDA